MNFLEQSGRILRYGGRVLAIGVVRFYQLAVSPIVAGSFGPACRFDPSCSEYAREAIAHHGALRGGWLALQRLLRCRPGGGWGYDPVVERKIN